jgi:retinol dehydrogenase 12
LLEHNAKVYLGARNQTKAKAAIEDLKQKTGKEAIWLKLDLADLKSVKAAAEEFRSKESRLDVLFNNAYGDISTRSAALTNKLDIPTTN